MPIALARNSLAVPEISFGNLKMSLFAANAEKSNIWVGGIFDASSFDQRSPPPSSFEQRRCREMRHSVAGNDRVKAFFGIPFRLMQTRAASYIQCT